MADISVTAANVALVTGPFTDGIAAATFTAGQVGYRLDAGTWGLAQRDGTAVEGGSNELGFALNGGASGQPIRFALPGADVTCGGTVAVGSVYTLSATAGGFTTDAAASGNYNGIVGLGKSTTRLRLILRAAEAVNA